jgi:hypothetical protein
MTTEGDIGSGRRQEDREMVMQRSSGAERRTPRQTGDVASSPSTETVRTGLLPVALPKHIDDPGRGHPPFGQQHQRVVQQVGGFARQRRARRVG